MMEFPKSSEASAEALGAYLGGTSEKLETSHYHGRKREDCSPELLEEVSSHDFPTLDSSDSSFSHNKEQRKLR